MVINTKIKGYSTFFLFFLLLILTPKIILAEVTPITPQQVDVTGIFMQEEIKTRADFKSYTDKKIADMITMLTKNAIFLAGTPVICNEKKAMYTQYRKLHPAKSITETSMLLIIKMPVNKLVILTIRSSRFI